MLQPMSSIFSLLFFMLSFTAAAQSVTQKLTTAFDLFEKDTQLQNAIASLYVTDSDGNVVFQKNASIGLAPASTQKVITAATAYELLGKDFRYKTDFGLLLNSDGTNSLYIKGSGDPTLGSWRWMQTRDMSVLGRIARAVTGIRLNATVVIDTSDWNYETIPGGWIWEDIGNYYGAGTGVFNWRENQYDIYLRSGATVGDPVVVGGTEPLLKNYTLTSKVTAAAKGSGDNAYIYFSPSSNAAIIRGTIPVSEDSFIISGALPDPLLQFKALLFQRLQVDKSNLNPLLSVLYTDATATRIFHTETSPPLDSIIYWLNKKSINLYAEALLKTIGYAKTGVGNTETGMAILKSFWKGQGIPETALNLVDGSGLSPLNRVTTGAQVAVLQYAKKQAWFPGFYNSLPEYNGMKLKSGTIRGVKGFAGYYTSRNGSWYTLSFIINNYNGSSAELVKKMYAVLDVLK